MRATVKNYLPAMACATTLLLCYFVIRPYAEIGISDDWSFIKSAQVLAQTGHIVYNGWATPMLGWQVFFAALLVKLFGFSFTAVRFSTVLEAMATAYLLQRTFVRAGLNAWNATLATMAFVLSPLYLPLAFTFMTDISGVLCIVACFYMCLRAVQAGSERSAMVWISLAALVNASGGTARQIAWLGVLVMVPCTLWLLRKSRRVLVVGSISCIAGAVFVVAAMHWFARQPYSISVSPFADGILAGPLRFLGGFYLRIAGQLALLALPVLMMFAGSFRSWNRRASAVFAAGIFCFAIPGVVLIRSGRLHFWLAPFMGNDATDSAFARLSAIAAWGGHLAIERNGLRILLTVAIVLGTLSLVACLFAHARGPLASNPATAASSWRQIWIIAGPFSAATVVLLTQIRQPFGFSDRYLLPLLMILFLVLARCYQERVQAKLPWTCVLLIILFGAFSVAATHDEFALYRGYLTAIDEIRSSGAPVNTILGPAEFDAWIEIDKTGYVNDPRIRVPAGAYVPRTGDSFLEDCKPPSAAFLDQWSLYFMTWTPAIKPVFATFIEQGTCGGKIAFPPAEYRTWIAPHTNWIYPVRLPASISR
ncbi:MAG: hypothetical protein WBE03_08205 [Terracidiphilus sp.]